MRIHCHKFKEILVCDLPGTSGRNRCFVCIFFFPPHAHITAVICSVKQISRARIVLFGFMSLSFHNERIRTDCKSEPFGGQCRTPFLSH